MAQRAALLSLSGQTTRRRAWRRVLDRLYIPLMLAPALLVMLVLYLGAFTVALVQSFGYAPVYRVNSFPTLKYYAQLFTSTGFFASLFYTFYYSLVPTVVGTIISIYLALLLRKSFRGKEAFKFVYKLPLMVPYLVGVFLVIIMFAGGGVFARILYALGIIQSTNEFPRLLYSTEGWGIMLVYLWKQIPFTTLVLFSVLLGLGREQEEVAATLGASRWQTFRYVILPRLLPGIVSATVIVFAFNFGNFEVPYILGVRYPNVLPVSAYQAYVDADYTKRPAAMAIIMFVSAMSGLILYIYLLITRRLGRYRG